MQNEEQSSDNNPALQQLLLICFCFFAKLLTFSKSVAGCNQGMKLFLMLCFSVYSLCRSHSDRQMRGGTSIKHSNMHFLDMYLCPTFIVPSS